jgi:hypothetical protein
MTGFLPGLGVAPPPPVSVSIVETAHAVDAVVIPSSAIVETAHAVDTLDAHVPAHWSVSLTERATAVDSIGVYIPRQSLNESASAADIVGVTVRALLSVVERATAQDHPASPTRWTFTQTDAASAADHLNSAIVRHVAVVEASHAADHPTIFAYKAFVVVEHAANASDHLSVVVHTKVAVAERAQAQDAIKVMAWIAPGSTAGLTFYTAWEPQTATAWSQSYARFDENVFSFTIEHDEGQIPKLTLQVKNPRVGLINPSRNYWFWLSYARDAGPAQPLFFGRLVGIPTSILANVVEMQFIARAPNYIYQKQQVAESLKILPEYDPIFFEPSKRDDPDAILEGWSALYHVDRITNQVSVSDILLGEDAVVSFHTQDVFYDSVQMRLLQSPLVAVNVKAEVTWEQRYRGFFNVGSWSYPTLGGDSFVGDWPKSGSGLGGGYSAAISWAGERDPSIAASMLAQMAGGAPTVHYEWRNTAKHHEQGDTMSIVSDYTSLPPNSNMVVTYSVSVPGIINPYTVDAGGNPDPTNQPLHEESHFVTWRTYALDFLGKQSVATLSLVYEPNRKRNEQLEFTLKADVQPILIDPLVTEDTEQITLKTGDLSMPVANLLNWSSVAGQPVSLGTMVFPDNPLAPGQTSSQICTTAGTTGLVEPLFSNVSGATTADGTVVWTSLGASQPVEQVQDWVRSANVPLGAMVLPKPLSGVADMNSMLKPGSLNYPPSGTAVTTFEVLTDGAGGPGAAMYEVTQAGFIGGLSGTTPSSLGLAGTSTASAQAVMQTFINPSGMFLYVCVKSGQTGLFRTTFNENYGSQTTDGTVVWQNIGLVTVPIGGWPGMTPARSYFPSDRGQQSLQHMMMRARAHLRKRARAVQISFDTRFEQAAQLSCRMSAGIADARLPGAQAYGKVIAYKLIADGDTGRVSANVTLGCSIGQYAPGVPSAMTLSSPSSPAVEGVPEYVVDGYVLDYQVYDGAIAAVAPTPPAGQGAIPAGGAPPGNGPPSGWPAPPVSGGYVSDPIPPPLQEPPGAMGYAPPVEQVTDDGLTFPASPNDLILISAWHGTASTLDSLNVDAYNEIINTTVKQAVAAAHSTYSGPVSAIGGTASESISVPQTDWGAIANAVEQAVIKQLQQGHGLWYELVMKPLTNGPFGAAYVVTTTDLQIPKTIDLSAPSTGG